MRSWFVIVCTCSGCHKASGPSCDERLPREAPQGGGGNILIVLMDDVGLDLVGTYGMHPRAAPTPNIDALARSGVRFDRAYATPSCSPTRASLLTGRHPSRTGLGWWMLPTADAAGLRDEEITIPEALRLADTPFSSALVGKWHLSPFDPSRSPGDDPLRQGFDRFIGLLGNADSSLGVPPAGDQLGGYYWEQIADGEITFRREWITAAQTDSAIEVMQALPEPWLLFVSYSAAHEPWFPPPGGDLGEKAPIAIVRDLDAEIGRLMQAVDLQQTTVLLLSDNGTPADGVQPPWNNGRSKMTLHDPGVRVPFIAAGRGVSAAGSTTEALVSVVDVLPTVADLAGVDVDDLDTIIDGRSLRPHLEGRSGSERQCLMVEHFKPNAVADPWYAQRAIYTRDRMLLRSGSGYDLYAIGRSPGDESSEPLRERKIERILRDELDRYDASVPPP